MGSRKLAIIAITFVTAVTTVLSVQTSTASAANTFIDDDGNVHEPSIEGIAAVGVTRGCNPPVDDRYCPTGLVTRAEMAVFLIRAMGEEGNVPSFQGRFPDVPAGLWFTGSIERAAAMGLTTGYTDGTFRPNQVVTRAEMAALLLRAKNIDVSGAQSSATFTDVPTDAWYAPWVDELYRSGITNGCGSSPLRYCPGDPVKRDAMASFLVRTFDIAPVLVVKSNADIRTAAYGPVDVACPSGSARVTPGDAVQSALDSAGASATVCFESGTHRISTTLRPRSGSTLVFEAGAILNGSRQITNWTASGGQWAAAGQTQSVGSAGTRCDANPAACEYEDLFWDGVPLVRVLSRSDLTSGKFFFDESADTIYVADDPTGHLVEATVAGTAIDAGGTPNVTVRNATIEKFGLHGIVTSSGWVVANNEIRYVHSHGVRAFGDTQVVGNYIHHAGNMAIFGQGDALVFDGNQLAYNNYLNFDLWHAGATKIVRSPDTIVRNNWSHHNNGDGWWFDWDNANAVVTNNLFEHNSRFGFFIEASFGAKIHDNTFYRNGDASQDETGAGLWISTSKDVEIYNNVFEGNVKTLILVTSDRGTSELYGNRQTTGMHAHDNTFILDQGYIGVAYGDSSVYSPGSNNRFTNNQYVVPNINGDWWRWGSPHNWSEWNAAGQDTTSTITTP